MATRKVAYPAAELLRTDVDAFIATLQSKPDDGATIAVFDSVVLPLRAVEGISASRWNNFVAGPTWAIRITYTNAALTDIRRGFFTRRDTSRAPLFEGPVSMSGDHAAWRSAAKKFYDHVSNQDAWARQVDTLALLRRIMVKPTWPEDPAVTLVRTQLLQSFDEAYTGPKKTGFMARRSAFQTRLLADLEKVYEDYPSSPPDLYDVTVDVLTLVAKRGAANDPTVTALVRKLLNYGIDMLFRDHPIDMDAVRLFVYVAGFNAREHESRAAAGLFFRDLVEALVLRKDGEGHIFLIEYVRDVARELGVMENSTLGSYRALEWTFTLLVGGTEFRDFLAMGNVKTPECLLGSASVFARLLLSDEKTVWMSVLAMCVNTTAVPGLFERVIQDNQLWVTDAATPLERSRMHPHKLGELLKIILLLRQEAMLPGAPAIKKVQAVRCFAVLTKVLVSLNAVHLLEVALRPDNMYGPVDSAALRSFQKDEGMRFSFLATNHVALKVLFSNALWSAYTLVSRLIRDNSDAEVEPDQSAVARGASAATGPAPLSAAIMSVFAGSIANPVDDKNLLTDIISGLIASKVNKAPLLSTVILSKLGELLPAGADDRGLVPVEAWLRDSVLPTLTKITERVVSLYPRVENIAVDDLYMLERAEKSIVTKSSDPLKDVRRAVADFSGCVILFEKPEAKADSLGADVAGLIENILDTLTTLMRKAVEVAMTREPAASATFVQHLSTMNNFLGTMRFFQRANMTKIVGKRVLSLYKAVQLMLSVSPLAGAGLETAFWCPADVRKSSSALAAWSDADLLLLPFFTKADAADAEVVDIDRATLFDAPEGRVEDAISSAVKGAFPDDRSGAKASAVHNAVLAHVHFHNSQALTIHCLREIQGVMRAVVLSANFTGIATISKQFQPFAERCLDKLIFSIGDFSASFRKQNETALAALGIAPATIEATLGAPALKALGDSTLKKFHTEFSSVSGIPVSFLLPSQLIAISVATRVVPRDVLLRLGTGQGKSIVLALSAIAAIQSPRGPTPPSRVFMLTTYDHLATRDHAFASKLFLHEGFKSCAITSDLTSIAGFASARIIYANVVAVDSLLTSLTMKVIQNKALDNDEEAFIQAFFNIGSGSYTVLLDEFDLILDDLRKKTPFVEYIPAAVISHQDVLRLREYCPALISAPVIDDSEASDAIDPDTGMPFSHVSYSMRNASGRYYNLTPSVFRLAQFLERAGSIVGVSGSTNDEDHYVLHGRGDAHVPYFALPYSHDPMRFDTRILPADYANDAPISGGTADGLQGGNGIWCLSRFVVAKGTTGLPSLADADDWCLRVINDIRCATDREGPKRPVLVFAPSSDTLFATGPPSSAGKSAPTKTLASHLIDAIKAAFSAEAVFVPPSDRDLDDSETQRIGQAGLITIADLKLGRGVDIRPSPDIPGGLHVLVATEVAHKRLLKQMIGRTGRIGRDGSYSIITLQRILAARPEVDAHDDNQWWMAALHFVTALGLSHIFANRATLVGASRKEWMQKWLLFLHGCRVRGKSSVTPAKWCIPDADMARLRGMAPASPATEPFYTRLAALQAAGPRSLDYPDA